MTLLTEEEVRALLKSKGKIAAVSAESGISQSYLSLAANGKVNMGKKVLDYLGVERLYRRKESGDKCGELPSE